MTIPTGLGSQFGLAKETTWATAVTPTKFYEFENESLNLTQNYQDAIGLRANRTFRPSGRMILTTRSADGDTPMQWPTKLGGSIVDGFNGVTNTPVQQAATTAYQTVFPIGTSLPNKSFTLQVNKPTDAGVDVPFTYPGSVLTQGVWTLDAGGVLMFTPSWAAQDETTPATTPAGASLASASYASGVTSLVGINTGVTITVNGVAQLEAKAVSLTLAQSYALDRNYLGSGGTRGKPVPNDYTSVSGSIDVDFGAQTLYNLYRSGAIIGIVIDVQGNTIASTYKEQIKFDLPAVQLRGSSPNVGGPDILTQTVPFEAGDNLSAAPLTITTMSTDVTL